MVGMNSVIMDEVVIGDECIIGALTFVKAGENFPSRSLIVGNPARVIKQVSDEMIAWKTEGTKLYQQLPSDCHQTLKPCEPLRSVPSERPKQPILYNFFKK
jgi:phenylacetic acid degradation protein